MSSTKEKYVMVNHLKLTDSRMELCNVSKRQQPENSTRPLMSLQRSKPGTKSWQKDNNKQK